MSDQYLKISILFAEDLLWWQRTEAERGKIFSCCTMRDYLQHIEWLKVMRASRPSAWPDRVLVLGKLAEEMKLFFDIESIAYPIDSLDNHLHTIKTAMAKSKNHISQLGE